MKIMVDKIFIERFNAKYNLSLTYADFKEFYIDDVKPFRNAINRNKLEKQLKEEQFIKKFFPQPGIIPQPHNN